MLDPQFQEILKGSQAQEIKQSKEPQSYSFKSIAVKALVVVLLIAWCWWIVNQEVEKYEHEEYPDFAWHADSGDIIYAYYNQTVHKFPVLTKVGGRFDYECRTAINGTAKKSYTLCHRTLYEIDLISQSVTYNEDDLHENCTHTHEKSFEHHTGAPLLLNEQYLYVIGGMNDTSVERFHTTERYWERFRDLTVGKQYMSVCTINETNIYLIGGWEDATITFWARKGKWITIQKQLPKPIFLAGCIQIDWRHILIIGGRDMLYDTLDTVYLFDTRKHTIKRLPDPMPVKSIFTEPLVKKDHFVYALGRQEGVGRDNRCLLQFNLKTFDWRVIDHFEYKVKPKRQEL